MITKPKYNSHLANWKQILIKIQLLHVLNNTSQETGNKISSTSLDLEKRLSENDIGINAIALYVMIQPIMIIVLNIGLDALMCL
jgi:hypothetical protein